MPALPLQPRRFRPFGGRKGLEVRTMLRLQLEYVPCYGSKWEEGPKIQRQLWKDAVLGVDERFDAKALRAKLLRTKFARRVITNSERMIEAANSPLRGFSCGFPKSFASWLRIRHSEGRAGTRTTSLDTYRERPTEDGPLPLYDFFQNGAFPLFRRGVGRGGGGPGSAPVAASRRVLPRHASIAKSLSSRLRLEGFLGIHG